MKFRSTNFECPYIMVRGKESKRTAEDFQQKQFPNKSKVQMGIYEEQNNEQSTNKRDRLNETYREQNKNQGTCLTEKNTSSVKKEHLNN